MGLLEAFSQNVLKWSRETTERLIEIILVANLAASPAAGVKAALPNLEVTPKLKEQSCGRLMGEIGRTAPKF
jgi:hypothetical protein